MIWKLIFRLFNSFFIYLLYAHIIYSIPRMPTTVQATIVSAFTCSVMMLFTKIRSSFLGLSYVYSLGFPCCQSLKNIAFIYYCCQLDLFGCFGCVGFGYMFFFCFLQINELLLIAFCFLFRCDLLIAIKLSSQMGGSSHTVL
jgi:hypothetical protein